MSNTPKQNELHWTAGGLRYATEQEAIDYARECIKQNGVSKAVYKLVKYIELSDVAISEKTF